MANDVPDELDVVTIIMVPKLTAEQADESTSANKRPRLSVCDVVTLGKVEVKASRLRKCSAYFEACMSERWEQSKSTSKTFHLEAQTEVKYYEDCFARMSFLCKPIASVKDGIELLKVASQIGFQAVVDIGVKYLAAAPWSDDEEDMVRDFCTSTYAVPCDSLRDLLARLEDLPPGEEEKQEKGSLAAMKLLSRLLREAIPDGTKSYDEIREEAPKSMEAAKKFTIAFRRIMLDAESGAVCDEVVEFATALVTQEALRLLKESSNHEDPSNMVLGFTYLFKLAQHSNVAQGIVELLVIDGDEVSKVLSALHVIYDQGDEARHPLLLVQRWAWMVYKVFEGVMTGKLFLQTSQRVSLFRQGQWFLRERFLSCDKTHLAEFVTRFVTTLPQREQEDCWATTCTDGEGPSSEAYAMWVSHMVIQKEKRQHQPDLPAGYV